MTFVSCQNADVYLNWSSLESEQDPCFESDIAPGTRCSSGAFYLGSLTVDSSGSPYCPSLEDSEISSKVQLSNEISDTEQLSAPTTNRLQHYMITPGGCAPDSSAPTKITCEGDDNYQLPWMDTDPSKLTDSPLENVIDYESENQSQKNCDKMDGEDQTNILTGELDLYAAAKYCQDLDLLGYDDWFLPNRQELNLIYTNRKNLPGIASNVSLSEISPMTNLASEKKYYWSSSEYGQINAWAQNFSKNNSQSSLGKTDSKLVRCIRKF